MSNQISLSETSATARRFSLRRMNPLRSPLQIILLNEARALSLDGVKWELQIRGEFPNDLWGGYGARGERVFFRFGYWSSVTGLRQVPMSPILNNEDLIPRAEQLLAELTTAWEQLPFSGIDVWELWLLDAEQGMPLTLLRTEAIAPGSIHDWSKDILGWRAREEEQTPGNNKFFPAEEGLFQEVVALIQGAAGGSPRVAWFGPQDGRPELPWRMDWPMAAESKLMQAYLYRQAPLLLTLSGIGDELRARLEQMARHEALEVAALWRLYPKVIDPGFLNTARVEARIRSSTSFGAQESKPE